MAAWEGVTFGPRLRHQAVRGKEGEEGEGEEGGGGRGGWGRGRREGEEEEDGVGRERKVLR